MKNAFALALSHTPSERILAWRTGLGATPLVLGYHRVVEDFHRSAETSIPAMLISRRMFERHLDQIGRRFEFVSLDDAASNLKQGRVFRKPAAAITFDDGYRDVYEHAFPLLKKKGIPAAVFVVTDLVGSARVPIHDKLHLLLTRALRRQPAELAALLRNLEIPTEHAALICRASGNVWRAMTRLLERLSQFEILRIVRALEERFEIHPDVFREFVPLRWEDIRQMRKEGVTIGSHTKTHALLTNEKWDRIVKETRDSKAALDEALGAPVCHFAYPDGRFGTAAVRAVEAAGYEFAYTTCLHRDRSRQLLTIPRKVLWERSSVNVFDRFSPSVMTCHLNWAFDLFRPCGRKHNGVVPQRIVAGVPVEGEL